VLAKNDGKLGPKVPLGLKLESSKGPGEFLVIDQAQKPSEN
jgi:uncharacterized protein (TIGR03435 family)